MFEGFDLSMIDTGDAVIRVRHGGDGPLIDCGHYLEEEAPGETYTALHTFLRA